MMNEAEASDFVGSVQKTMAGGNLPEIDNFTRDQKNTLLCLAKAFEGERSRDIAAKVLPILQSPDDVQALLFCVKVAKALRVAVTVAKFLISLPGAVIVALASSVTGIVDPRKALEWLVELSKLQ